MANTSLAKNFEFKNIVSNWNTYNSSRDKTNVAENVYVHGSKNVYKKLSGNIAVREGQKRLGVSNDAASATSSEFVWNTSWGATYTLIVADTKLCVAIDDVWYTLLDPVTETRYVFDNWWDDSQKKDEVLFVNGNDYIQMWSGGNAVVESSSNTAISLKGNNTALTSITTAGGTSAVVADFNSLVGTSFEGSLVFPSNPTNGQTLILNLNGTAVSIQFVSVIGAVAGNVLIGATTSDTKNNLLGLLQSPGTTTANHVALSGANQTLVGYITYASTFTITKTGSPSWQQSGFTNQTFTTIGDSTTQFDITNPTGTTFRYTWDTTGTDPVITAARYPVGTYILIEAENFNAGNNGIFVITAVGTNYFEVTNASGVAEANKTIGTGFIYRNYTKVIIINNVIYSYTGGTTTTTLTGVTPDPSAITPALGVLQAVITYNNTPADGFNNDFIKVINNQLYVGSYTSRLIYISSNTDFTDFVVPSPRLAGSPELLTLDGTGKGISVRQGNAWISFGTSSWASVSFANITVGTTLTQQTKVDIKPVALLQAAYAHEFIDTVGDSIVYLAQDQQVRTIGDFTNLFTPGYPSLSQPIATELMEEDFVGGGLRCIGEFTYVTAPRTGNVYLYQVRQSVDENNQVVTERMWHAPFVWNVTRVDTANGLVIGFSNANPQIYQLWDTGQWHDDSPSDEALPYECVLALSYRGEQRRQGLWSFDKLYTEGYITLGTPLNFLINYNYQGAGTTVTGVINSTMRPTYIFTPNASSPHVLGDEPLGDDILGDEFVASSFAPDDLPKFKNISSLSQVNCFEYQPVYYSNSADAQWEILAVATNAEVTVEQQAEFIINKVRT